MAGRLPDERYPTLFYALIGGVGAAVGASNLDDRGNPLHIMPISEVVICLCYECVCHVSEEAYTAFWERLDPGEYWIYFFPWVIDELLGMDTLFQGLRQFPLDMSGAALAASPRTIKKTFPHISNALFDP